MTDRENELDYLRLHGLLKKVFGDGFEDFLALLLQKTREERIELVNAIADLADAEDHFTPIVERMKADGFLNGNAVSHHHVDAESMAWLENKTQKKGADYDSK